MDAEITAIDTTAYSGKISGDFLSKALTALNQYRSDRESFLMRIRDNERYYKSLYSGTSDELKKEMKCNTSFIFSSIENAVADAAENYPMPNVLEREPDGAEAAEALSQVLPVLLKSSGFYKVYKKNARNKCKLGTAAYGVFYNEDTQNVDIRSVNILNILCDMNVDDIQDSSFLFITAMVENELLKHEYPEHEALFTGDATQETISGTNKLLDRSEVCDCYYKKPDGTLHMMKLCHGKILEATEDMEGYEEGLYKHGRYPVVLDVLYQIPDCPFGFGMIDIGKATQIEIDKLDTAITKNILINAAPRYLAKEGAGLKEDELMDLEKAVVHYKSGDTNSIMAIQGKEINQYYINHRENKKDELKEILANRDFQQGATNGGVTAASAIENLQQAGEKRSRSQLKDTYAAYKDVAYMVIELIRQFYYDARYYRTEDDYGHKTFIKFSNEIMTRSNYVPYEPAPAEDVGAETEGEVPVQGHWEYSPIEFDIEVVPQRDNPYTREAQNNTILTIFGSALVQNLDMLIIALKNMSFDNKETLISDIQDYQKQIQEQQAQMQQIPAQAAQGGDELVPVDISAQDRTQQADIASIPDDEEVIPMAITGG
ncbi:MAG: hypothetical protein ACI38A_06790 [Candidatus Ornithomonoglobus sp.]